MKLTRRGTGITAGVVCAVIVAGSFLPATAAQPALTIDPNDVRHSIAYLTRQYGITETEALRRLETQKQAESIDTSLSRALPENYAGLWIDQDNGGQLVIAMKGGNGSAVRKHVTSRAVRFRIQQAAYSLKELTEARPAGSVSYVDYQRNRLVVQGAKATSGRILADAPDQREAKELAAWIAAERELRLPPKTAGPVPSCTAFLCKAGPPMRGGYRLDVSRDAGGRGPCTNGFNFVNLNNGALYTLTAGHCVRGTRHTLIDRTFHNNLAVGIESTAAGLVNNVYPTDYAAIPYVSTAVARYWMPSNRNEVSALCVAGESTTACRTGAIPMKGITRYEDMRSGFVVCHTGSTEPDYGGAGWKPGTRCGVINGWTGAGIRTNTCGRPGDSGGPLFSEVSGTAYGILYGGSTVQGACRVGAEFSTFSPISKIYTKLPANIRLVVRPF